MSEKTGTAPIWMPAKFIKPRLFPRTEPFQRPDRPDQPTLEDLASSINRKGMLYPVIIDHNSRIVSGDRRFRAVTTCLGWDMVPVEQGDFMTVARGMAAEHTNRVLQLPMTLSEQLKINLLLEQLATPYRQRTYRKAAGVAADDGGPSRREITRLIGDAMGIAASSLDALRALRVAYLDPDARTGQKRSDANPDLARRVIEDDANHLQQPYRARDMYIRALEKRAGMVGSAKAWREKMPSLLGQLNALGIAVDGLNALPQGLGEEEVSEWHNQLASHMRTLQQLKARFAAYHEGA